MFFKNKRLIFSVGILFVLVCVLAILHTVSGPRLVGTKIQGYPADKTLQLSFNSSIDSSDIAVSVEPQTMTTHTVQGKTAFIHFIEPLLSNTQYEVYISGVTDSRGKSSNARVSFITEPQSVAYLKRGETQDIIMKKIINEPASELVSRPFIEDFVVGKDDRVLSISRTNTEMSSLFATFTHNNKEELLLMPFGVPVGVYGASSSADFYIKTRDMQSFKSKLFLYESEKNKITELSDSTDNPIDNAGLLIAADGRTIAYQNASDNAAVIFLPLSDRSSIALGRTVRLLRFMPNNSAVFFESDPGTYGYTDNAGTFSVVDVDPTINEVLLLQDLKRYIGIKNTYRINRPPEKEIVVSREGQLSTLYRSDNELLLLNSLSINAQDEYISFEKSSETPILFDNYVLKPRPVDAQTILFDLANETTIDTVDGTLLQWL